MRSKQVFTMRAINVTSEIQLELSPSAILRLKTADEKPDGQAENDQRNGAAENGLPQQ